MARLPVPGSDDGAWGDLLNEFLAVEHNADGTLKLNGTLAGKYAKPASGIPKNDLASDVQTSLAKVDEQLPLTGGTLSGQLRINADLRIANPLNTGQYLRIWSDNFWSRIEPTGTSGFVFRGGTVMFEPGVAVFNTSTVKPQNNLVTNLGDTSYYYNTIYAQRHYLNATAYLDGATAGAVSLTGNLGIQTTSPTHSLTLGSAGSGLVIYNTADQTTNYERGGLFWTSSMLKLTVDAGGTGTVRRFRVGTSQGGTDDTYIEFNAAGGPKFTFMRVSPTSLDLIGMSYTASASSSVQKTLSLTPIVNQSGTAGYTALYINPTEQATGSGTKLLIDAQVGGTSKFSVANTGSISLANGADVSLGTVTGTKIGTSPNQKLGFFNATPVVQPTGGTLSASASYGANEQTMINTMWNAMRSLGLMN